ncbi:MAG: CoA transferase [Gemmatimonadetes bacterium]|nr:CoA transferase [Gemmatimonadota bacterium]
MTDIDASRPEISPLSGVRVVDFSQNLAGPYAAQILGDLGADVVKVEPPGGDPARGWGPPFIGGNSHLFQAVNRNKRSVILDLKTPGGRERARELAAEADVVIQALRFGVADRLGIGYDRIRDRNPRVVYVSVTSHGLEGPLRDDPGYDPLMQARSGLMSVTGERDGRPVRVGTSIVDLGTGTWTAIAVLGALMERERTGRGCHVTASLLDTSLAWMSYHLTSYLATGEPPGPMGTSIAMIAPYEAFPCTDGSVMIAAGNDDIFGRLCRALELDLTEDPDFARNADRVANSRRLAEIVAARTRRHSVNGLLELLSSHCVPAAPIHTVASALEDPQTAATGMLRSCAHPAIDNYVDIPMPVRWDGRRAGLRRFPPDTGEHQGELFPDE